MSDEKAPKWHYIVDSVVKTLARCGAVYLYFAINRPGAIVKQAIDAVDARVKEKTEPMEVKLKSLEVSSKEIENDRSSFQATAAALEARKNAKPQLLIRPILDDAVVSDDVRSLRFEVQFINAGLVDVPLKQLDVRIYGGVLSKSAADIIQRTELIAHARGELSRAISPQPSTNQGALSRQKEELKKRMQELHTPCPHGQIFSLSAQSKDVQWSEIPEYHEVQNLLCVLGPQQSASCEFRYLMTELTETNTGWLKLVFKVQRTDVEGTYISYVIPMRHQEVITVPQMQATTFTDSDGYKNPVFRWTTQSPLIPTPTHK